MSDWSYPPLGNPDSDGPDHELNEYDDLPCYLCEPHRLFRSTEALAAHLDLVTHPDYPGANHWISRAHPTEWARVWTCPHCGIVYFHDDPLSDHIYDCHGEGS